MLKPHLERGVKMDKKLVNHSPHILSKTTTSGIMLDVLIALTPATLAGFVLFGPRAILIVAVSILSALVSEFVCCKVMKRPVSLGDLSAVVTGLLLALNLPSTLPIWMVALGSSVAIVVVKMMFGGIGSNFANPAMVGRIVLMVSFASYMTSWVAPFSWFTSVDAVTTATPLAAEAGSYTYLQLLLGLHGGCIGEGNAILLLLGGLYLVFRRVIKPYIPLSFILTVFLFSWALGLDPLYAILSGGVMLGAIFMATDYVTSPHNTLGGIIFGLGCGIFTVVIRQFGALPEGVSYSILLMNLLTPHIENLTRRKPFGWEARKNG